MTTTAPSTTTGSTEGTRRFGYFVAIVVNLVLLWVVQNILTWDVAPFLTDDFEILIPITSVSLMFGAAINLAYMGSTRPGSRRLPRWCQPGSPW